MPFKFNPLTGSIDSVNSRSTDANFEGEITTPRFETQDLGIKVIGKDGGTAQIDIQPDLGDSNADKWKVGAEDNGHFFISNKDSGDWDKSIAANRSGNVELYFDGGAPKLATFSDGVLITGQMVITESGTTAGGAFNLALKNTNASNDYSLLYFQSTDSGSSTSTTGSIRSNFVGSGSTNGQLEIQTRKAGTLTTGLTLDENQNATFAGKLEVTGNIEARGSTDVKLYLGSTGDTTANNNVHLRADLGHLKLNSADGKNIYFEENGNTLLTLEHSAGAATFAGLVYSDRFINSTTSADPWLKGVNASGTETCYIKKDGTAYFAGNIVMGADKGINFAATDNSGQSVNLEDNLLDDYEQGTWTPASAIGTIAAGTCSYTKIGRLVTATFALTFPTSSTGGAQYFSGLPFTSINEDASGGVAWGYRDLEDDGPIVSVDKNDTVVKFYNTTLTAQLTDTQLSGKSFRGVVTYFTDT